MPAAVALELIHNFSLIHDDIQDQDTERHHRPTVWAVWDPARALMAGNTMRMLAHRAALAVAGRGVSPGEAPTVLAVLAGCSLELIEGQYLDLSFEERQEVQIADYLDMVHRKTGALIEAALHLGAYLGAGEPGPVDALRRCGRLLGLAFQARDDFLGIWGVTALTGKAVGADIRRKKKSLPVVYAFQHASGEQRRRLQALYRLRELDDDAVTKVLAIMEDLGARGYVQTLAAETRDEAMALAHQARLPGWALEEFRELADFLIYRLH
jgi:geranylgeranyl diphosphate synthase type I